MSNDTTTTSPSNPDRLLPGWLSEAMGRLDTVVTGDPVLRDHPALRDAVLDLQSAFMDRRAFAHECSYREQLDCEQDDQDVEPPPGWEDRAVERARDEGVIGGDGRS